ncbi:MAG: protease modulator HflK [Verrucomicrobia bacterium]|nr:protease modulator HflK [Verrucomicrobiota bacterium]
MSDHKHPHDHSHGEHHHEEDHGHGAPAPGAPVMIEDAGSRALSEALRSSFVIVRVLMAGLVLLFLASGFFTVGPHEKKIILRFGKPVGEGEKALLGPGFHWAFPAPIDEVVSVPVTQIQQLNSTVGWYATTPAMEAAKAEPPPGPSLNPAIDGYVLTGDANIIHLRATLRYRITDPIRYTFDFSDAPALVRNALNNALLFASSQYTVDNALTRDVTGLRDRVYNRLLQLIDQQALGIEIESPTLQAIPPRQLSVSFEQVSHVAMQSQKLLNEARSYENETLSKARSEATARINAGETEKTRLVEFVAAEAKKFQDLLPQYSLNPELFVQLRQAEVLQRVMMNAQEKIYIPSRADGQKRELRLQLNREPQKSGAQQ